MCKFHKVIAVSLLFHIVVFITSTSGEKNVPLSPSTSNNSSTRNAATVSNNNGRNVTNKTEVLMEGGGQIDTQIKPAVTHSVSRGREGENVQSEPMHNGSKSASTSGGVPPSLSTSSKIEVQNSSSPVIWSTPSAPIYEDKPEVTRNVSKVSEHKTISARKGVNLTDFIEHQSKSSTTTVKPKVKKPTLTVASDEEPYAPSHFQPISKSNSSASQSIPKVPNFDMLNENNQGNTQKYVVPIVIVILSVPFVAILISILYKRGSEWWKYRHYRRMDFLINGMYDN